MIRRLQKAHRRSDERYPGFIPKIQHKRNYCAMNSLKKNLLDT
ncbi:uncharacterized protein METZ01_LOCUS401368, partial [marine metagenome]